MERFIHKIKRCSPWAFLPPLYTVCFAVGVVVVYTVALAHGKVAPLTSHRPNKSALPPYISIAGNSPPASCIFSQVMNMGAFAGMVIAVFRYVQIKNTLYKPWLNNICLLLICFACFGMTLIGNFQVFVDEEIHNFGSFLTFGLGTVYCWIQSCITLKVNLKGEGFRTSILRFVLSAGITTCAILYPTLLSQDLHMHAARAQWALVMFMIIFIGTFCVEFRHSRMDFQVKDVSAEPVGLSFTEMSANHSDSP